MQARFVRFERSEKIDPRTGRNVRVAHVLSPGDPTWEAINVPLTEGTEEEIRSYAASKLGLAASALQVQRDVRYGNYVIRRAAYAEW